MTLTENLIDGSGSNTYNFTFPILDKQDVKVQLREFDPNQLPEDQIISQISTTAFDVLSSPNRVVFTPLADETIYQDANGDVKVTSSNGYQVVIRIYRDTDIDGTAAYFYPGSAIRAEDLNDNFRQLLFNAQESAEELEDILGGIFPDESIPGSALKDGAVTTDKLADGAVTTDKIYDDAVTPEKLDRVYLEPGDNVSELVNDADYLSIGDNVSDLVNDLEYLEPGDNVSELTNDVGYITAAEVPPTGVTQIVAGNNVTITPSGGTGVVTVNSTGGGGSSGVSSIIAGDGISVNRATGDVTITNTGTGGGGDVFSGDTPVPQKVAYLRDEKPSGTTGGDAVVGWQDRTINTKEDANNLVILGNDKEFTLSAGEYQIEWSAPGCQVQQHRTKLTNVTDGTTQELGSSGFSGNLSSLPQTSSFGSTRIKITSDTTYKIEHFCDVARETFGLGVASVTGDPEVYTQVTITDLAIVGGTGTESKTNIYGTAKAWGDIAADGTIKGGMNIASVVKATPSSSSFDITFSTPMPDANYSITMSSLDVANQGRSVTYKTKTASGFTVVSRRTDTGDGESSPPEFSFAVHDDTSAEVALTTFGDVINYSGPAAWAYTQNDGVILSGSNLNCSVSGNQFSYTFNTPMPSANYSIQATIDANSSLGWIRTWDRTVNGFTVTTNDQDGTGNAYRHSVAVFATNALPPKGGTGTDAWVQFNGLSSVGTDCTIAGSFNVERVEHTGAGKYEVYFVNDMPNMNYACLASGSTYNSSIYPISASSFQIRTFNASGDASDPTMITATVNATNATLPSSFSEEQIQSVVDLAQSGATNPGASAWGNIAADGTLLGGLNCQVQRTGPGNYTVTFITPMPSSAYSVVQSTGSTVNKASYFNLTANGFEVNTRASAQADIDNSFAVFATNSLPPRGGTGTDAWGSVQGDGTIDASFNVASVTKTALGTYDVVFTTPMPTGNYAITTSCQSGQVLATYSNPTSTGFQARMRTADGTGNIDYPFSFTVNATNATLPDTFTAEQIQSVVDLAQNPQGIAKAWVKYDGTTQTVLSSYNVESVSRSQTGNYTVNFTNSFSSSDYCVQVSSIRQNTSSTDNYSEVVSVVTPTTSSCGVLSNVATTSSGIPAMDTVFYMTVFD